MASSMTSLRSSLISSRRTYESFILRRKKSECREKLSSLKASGGWLGGPWKPPKSTKRKELQWVPCLLDHFGAPTAPSLGLAWSRVGLAVPALQREPKMAPNVKESPGFLALLVISRPPQLVPEGRTPGSAEQLGKTPPIVFFLRRKKWFICPTLACSGVTAPRMCS